MLINKHLNMIKFLVRNQGRCEHVRTNLLSWQVTPSPWKTKSAAPFSDSFSVALKVFSDDLYRNSGLVHFYELRFESLVRSPAVVACECHASLDFAH